MTNSTKVWNELICFYQEATFSESTFSTYSSYMLATTLRQEFPEVEAACAVYQRETGLKTKEGKRQKLIACMPIPHF